MLNKKYCAECVKIWYNQQKIVGCGMLSMDKCVHYICDMIAKGTDLSGMITHRFPLEQIDEAMRTHGNAEIAQKVAIVY